MELDFASLAICFVFGLIGIVAWRYGKTQTSARHMLIGIALMAYGYFVSNVWANLGIGVGLTFLLFFP